MSEGEEAGPAVAFLERQPSTSPMHDPVVLQESLREQAAAISAISFFGRLRPRSISTGSSFAPATVVSKLSFFRPAMRKIVQGVNRLPWV